MSTNDECPVGVSRSGGGDGKVVGELDFHGHEALIPIDFTGFSWMPDGLA